MTQKDAVFEYVKSNPGATVLEVNTHLKIKHTSAAARMHLLCKQGKARAVRIPNPSTKPNSAPYVLSYFVI